ncbi:MAG: hypothetical protein HQL25_06735 [Candidatus Omnitrophica bacterium]|nr:hypothetical protein [Candidatus Omnitrophota bacterium]
MLGKTILYFLIVFCFLKVSAYGQEWPTVENIVAKVQTELNLVPEQLVKVKLIIADNMRKRQQIKPQLTEGLTQAQSQPLDAELYSKLSEVLTREQMGKWNKILEVMLQEMYANSGSK